MKKPKLFSRLIISLLVVLFNLNKSNGQLQLQLTPSFYQNGFHISCFGAHDGNIDLTITNGNGNYTYDWSNGATTQDVSDLPAGYYVVRVNEVGGGGSGWAEITLKEPQMFISANVSSYIYPNGYNVTCNSCLDGSIAVSIEQGTPPYTFQWNDGETTQDRTGIHAGAYEVAITDNSGCIISESITLTSPGSEDWTVYGNSNSNPNFHFIGTLDEKDLVFKTHSLERLKLMSNGDIKFPELSGSFAMLYIDGDGILHAAKPGPVNPCTGPGSSDPVWRPLGASTIYSCPSIKVGIGMPYPPADIQLGVSGNTYIDGLVGIGDTYIPNGYQLAVNGKIICEEVFVKLRSTWPDYVFERDYLLTPLNELKKYIVKNKHLPEVPSSKEMQTKGGITLGESNAILFKKIEELTLYIIQQNEKLEFIQSELDRIKR